MRSRYGTLNTEHIRYTEHARLESLSAKRFPVLNKIQFVTLCGEQSPRYQVSTAASVCFCFLEVEVVDILTQCNEKVLRKG